MNRLFLALILLVSSCQGATEKVEQTTETTADTVEFPKVMKVDTMPVASKADTAKEAVRASTSAAEVPLEVVSTEGPTLTFSNGERFTTNLYQMEYLGMLPTQKPMGYLLLSGKPCQECDAQEAIYLHHPADGPMADAATLQRMPYPGLERHYETGEEITETRFFFGELSKGQQAAIWFMKQKVAGEKWQENQFMFSVQQDTLAFMEGSDKGFPKLSTVETLAKKGKLIELPGHEYFSEP